MSGESMGQCPPLKSHNFAPELVIVTGLGRSCKQMVAPIISSFEKAEHVSMFYLLEQIVESWRVGLMGDEVASKLVRFGINNLCYNISIGRNLNLRFGDYTGIWRSSKVGHNLKKLISPEGDAAYSMIKDTSPLYVMMVHNGLWQSQLYFSACPSVKMINTMRHPIDIVHSWYSKGYDGSFVENLRNATLTLEWNGDLIPYYAKDWEEHYLCLNPMDRIIESINYLTRVSLEQYERLSDDNKKRVFFLYVDQFFKDPFLDLPRIYDFLGARGSKDTLKILKRERCPRDYENGREEKYLTIKALASTKAQKLLDGMISEYECKRFSSQ